MPAAEFRLSSTDIDACQAMLKEGSKSFDAAGKLLPARLRGPVAAVYAFCRASDDAVDIDGRQESLTRLYESLERVYRGVPRDHFVERAFTEVVHAYRIPRAVPDALLEGFQWDLDGRRYSEFHELVEYAVRVASTVGVMMTLLMGERRHEVLARACELGVAMQLTNIARDVGEDARNGRIYLPLAWLRSAGVDVEEFLRRPMPTYEVRSATRRLLERANAFYLAADVGVPHLPRDCRVAIRAARLIYSQIGRVVRDANYDSITTRAQTTQLEKVSLLLRAAPSRVFALKTAITTPPLLEAKFLIESVEP